MPVNPAKMAAQLILEIYFRHCLDDGPAEFDNGDVVRMDCVGVKHRTVTKDGHEAGIVRARRVQDVEPNRETFYPGNDVA